MLSLLASLALAADSSLHLAGYGASGVAYDLQEERVAFDGVTFAPVLLWRHGERVLIESELAFGYTEAGFASTLEYADLQVDLGGPVLYAGMFLTPVGQFTQRLHPAWINRFPDFPLPYRVGVTPMSHIGLGLQHAVRFGPHKVGATVFVDNGPAYADGDPTLTPQVGDENADKGVGGRIGLFPVGSLELGGSAYTGAIGGDASVRYTLLVGDVAFTHGGWLDVRGEYLRATWGDARFDGAWGQAGWRLRQVPVLDRLEPVVRVGWAKGDTPQPAAEEEEEAHAKAVAAPKSVGHDAGGVDLGDEPAWEVCYALDYWLRPNVVLKGTFTHSVETYAPKVGLSFGYGF